MAEQSEPLFFRYVPDLEDAPSYLDLSPLGVPERVHVITTLEDR